MPLFLLLPYRRVSCSIIPVQPIIKHSAAQEVRAARVVARLKHVTPYSERLPIPHMNEELIGEAPALDRVRPVYPALVKEL